MKLYLNFSQILDGALRYTDKDNGSANLGFSPFILINTLCYLFRMMEHGSKPAIKNNFLNTILQ
jgi:hypothetical protein